MDYKFLPETIKERLSSEPDFVLRGCGGFSGKPGESYLILHETELLLFEKNFSEKKFAGHRVDCHSPALSLELNQTPFSSELKIIDQYTMKLSGLETGTAALMIGKIDSLRQHSLVANEAVSKPFMILLMILTDLKNHGALENSDDNVLEKFIIDEICRGNRPLYLAGQELHQQGKLTKYLSETNLSIQQKRCILANMLELVMRDGQFSKTEQNMISEYGDKLGLGESEFNTVWDVILDKNCLAMLAE